MDILKILSDLRSERSQIEDAIIVSATEAYFAIVGEVPSSLYQDGVQRIHNASAEQSAARKQLMKAHNRFNDFLSRGIVPEDLKQQLS